MASPRTALLSLLALLGALAVGCATPLTDQAASGLDSPSVKVAADDRPKETSAPANTGAPTLPVAPSSTAPEQSGPPRPEQLVSQFQGLDAAAQARLLADLKQTDPALWPQLLQTFQVAARRGRAEASRNNAPPQQTLDGASAPAVNAVASGLRDHPYHPLESRTPQPQPNAAAQASQPTPGGLAQAFTARRDPQAALASLNDPLDGNVSGATQVSYEAPVASSEDAVAAAIRALEAVDANAALGSQESTRKQIELRLLCLAAGRRDEALRPIPGMTAAEQEYWSSQLFALAAWLDTEKIPAADRRANEALAHLDAARGKLAELGGLQVRNPQFCTRVDGYGSFTKFKEYAFKPGQDVVLYVELDNFRCESTDGGYRTALSSRYRILDSQSKQVTEHEFPAIEEVCQNRRRDYYISFRVTMPQRIYNGRHTLQLTVEDTLGKKVGQTSIEFTIQE